MRKSTVIAENEEGLKIKNEQNNLYKASVASNYFLKYTTSMVAFLNTRNQE